MVIRDRGWQRQKTDRIIRQSFHPSATKTVSIFCPLGEGSIFLVSTTTGKVNVSKRRGRKTRTIKTTNEAFWERKLMRLDRQRFRKWENKSNQTVQRGQTNTSGIKQVVLLMNERTQQDISIENDNYQRLECEKVGEDQGVCMERTNKRKTNSTSTGKIQSTRRMFNVGRVEEKWWTFLHT